MDLHGRGQVARSSSGGHAVGVGAAPSALAVVPIKGDGKSRFFCLCRALPSLFFAGRDVVIVDRLSELTICEIIALPRDPIVEWVPAGRCVLRISPPNLAQMTNAVTLHCPEARFSGVHWRAVQDDHACLRAARILCSSSSSDMIRGHESPSPDPES